jgi:hypothetical protein
MTASVINGTAMCLAGVAIGVAVLKWRVLNERDALLATIRTALSDRRAFRAGILFAAFYLAVFMILGGKGGRIHILFGRWILNATAGELIAALALSVLVMVSMALFVYGVRLMGSVHFRKKGAIGLSGTLLALLAAFCP